MARQVALALGGLDSSPACVVGSLKGQNETLFKWGLPVPFYFLDIWDK